MTTKSGGTEKPPTQLNPIEVSNLRETARQPSPLETKLREESEQTRKWAEGPDFKAPPTDTHLISDHDQIGEAKNWCGAESFNNTEEIVKTTCMACLKAAAIYGDGARDCLNRMSVYGELNLDVNFETARVLHRIVRAMNDGECPQCHALIEDYHMRKAAPILATPKHTQTMICPRCGFTITGKEAEAAINAFAPVMERNLAIFEDWRRTRK